MNQSEFDQTVELISSFVSELVYEFAQREMPPDSLLQSAAVKAETDILRVVFIQLKKLIDSPCKFKNFSPV